MQACYPSPMQPLIVTLLDIPVMMEAMNGVCLELQDCALTLLKGKQLRVDGFIHKVPLSF